MHFCVLLHITNIYWSKNCFEWWYRKNWSIHFMPKKGANTTVLLHYMYMPKLVAEYRKLECEQQHAWKLLLYFAWFKFLWDLFSVSSNCSKQRQILLNKPSVGDTLLNELSTSILYPSFNWFEFNSLFLHFYLFSTFLPGLISFPQTHLKLCN